MSIPTITFTGPPLEKLHPAILAMARIWGEPTGVMFRDRDVIEVQYPNRPTVRITATAVLPVHSDVRVTKADDLRLLLDEKMEPLGKLQGAKNALHEMILEAKAWKGNMPPEEGEAWAKKCDRMAETVKAGIHAIAAIRRRRILEKERAR